MSIFCALQTLYLCHLSKPAEDRPVYRLIHRSRVRKVVELGIGDGLRTRRMLEMVRRAAGEEEVHYVGVDPFEARTESDGPGLTLKAAYQLLRTPGVRVQLVPGEPTEALARIANAVGKIDLLIVSADLEAPSRVPGWLFVPRMLHEHSAVFVQKDGRGVYRTKPHAEIHELAVAVARHRAA